MCCFFHWCLGFSNSKGFGLFNHRGLNFSKGVLLCSMCFGLFFSKDFLNRFVFCLGFFFFFKRVCFFPQGCFFREKSFFFKKKKGVVCFSKGLFLRKVFLFERFFFFRTFCF